MEIEKNHLLANGVSHATYIEWRYALKELQNPILRTILMSSLFYSIQVYTSLYFLPILLENEFVFLHFLYFLSVLNPT